MGASPTPMPTPGLCPMSYALCPMPARAPHVTEKGYRCIFNFIKILLAVRTLALKKDLTGVKACSKDLSP
jgi:hypothetical protein